MKLIDIKELPARAGEAELEVEEYNNSYRPNPLARRESKTIVFSETETARFYSIKDGQQFLYTAGVGENRRLFFGGMDESPFLVELYFPMIESLMDGEEAFFNGLKPKIVAEWEAVLKTTAKRQGDFFAVPFFKQDWGGFLKQYLGKGTAVTSFLADGFRLRGTRHCFTGLIATSEKENRIIGDGVIMAPDHENLYIPGPHLIEQAIGFVRPQEAD